MKKFIELPWGDVVNREHVAGASVDREGVGFRVIVSMKTEGLQYLGTVHETEALAEADRASVRDLLVHGSRGLRVPRPLRIRDRNTPPPTSTSDDALDPPGG